MKRPPPPGTYEAASRGCACAAAGSWRWVERRPLFGDDETTRRVTAPPLEHKDNCPLRAKEHGDDQ